MNFKHLHQFYRRTRPDHKDNYTLRQTGKYIGQNTEDIILRYITKTGNYISQNIEDIVLRDIPNPVKDIINPCFS